MKKYALLFVSLFLCVSGWAQKQIKLASPDGKVTTTIEIGDQITYDINVDGEQVLAPSPISMTLAGGEVWGDKAKLSKKKTSSVNEVIPSPFYRKKEVVNHYNQVTLSFRKQWGIEFRAYDNGIAYRFTHQRKQPFNVEKEGVSYQFDSDVMMRTSYSNRGNDGDFASQYFNSFEQQYTYGKLSAHNTKRLMFLPLVATAKNGVQLCITEVNLNNYPGLFLTNQEGGNKLVSHMALYPKTLEQGGHNNLQLLVKERENFIAKVDGPCSFPWRLAVIARSDIELADNDLTYCLAEPNQIGDVSWVKPGKVAWDWWNAWNVEGVDFRAGVNNDTYKYYIDFASKHGIEYVILDEGWSVRYEADLLKVIPEIDMRGIIDYAKSKNVGIILWAGYYALDRDMENVCKHYSEMGVKGFKIDFMDGDDQRIVDFVNRAAKTCAKYKLMADFHGMYKPAGLNRTYPNVINFEGVFGLEQSKWSGVEYDQVKYDTEIPFIRQLSGPMDYTQGAMKNGTKQNFRAVNEEPMSQGTRCHQLALYVIFESPLNMLCDAPSNYMKEQESLDYIAEIPTVWDETVVLEGKIGEYVVMARRSGDTWYVGGITNWTPRDLTIDLSALKMNGKKAVLFKDGINADRKATDYKRQEISLSDKLNIHLAPGGGFAMKIK